MASLAVQRTIWIDAPRPRVWQAVSDPAQLAQWFAPGIGFKSTGEGPGARLAMTDPDTGAELYPQILTVVEPPHRLDLETLAPAPRFTTSYTLDDAGGGTHLTLVYRGYEGLPPAVRAQVMEENAQGFARLLADVKAFVEGAPLPQAEPA